MNRIDKFGIKFADGGEAPFFQAQTDKRLRFSMDFLEQNSKIVKDITDEVFFEDEKTDISFISGQVINNKRLFIKSDIGKFFEITNWRETIVFDEDLDATLILVDIKDVSKVGIKKYIQKMSKGNLRETYIVFYNDSFLVHVCSDVMDIVSHDKELIEKLKLKFCNNIDPDM